MTGAAALPVHAYFQTCHQIAQAIRRTSFLDLYWLLVPEAAHGVATWAASTLRGTGASSAP